MGCSNIVGTRGRALVTEALEVGRVIMLDKMKLLKKAAELKIELIGYSW